MTAANKNRNYHNRDFFIFCLLLLFSAALRTVSLDQGLWLDEIRSVQTYFHAPWLSLLNRMPNPNHHPLYSLAAKLMISVWGGDEWALRLPAFVMGSLTPPLMYLFAVRFVNRQTGLIAGLFMSVSMWPVWFSQDARGYSAMILFTFVSTYLYISYSEKRSRHLAAGYIMAAAAAVYSHMYGGAVPAAHLLVALFHARKKDERSGWLSLSVVAASGLLLALILYLPFVPDFVSYVKGVRSIIGRAVDAGLVFDLLRSWSTWNSPLFLLPVFLVLAGLGLAVFSRRVPLFVQVWTLALLIGLAVPFVLKTFAYARFLSYAVPGFYLFCAGGIYYLWSLQKPAWRGIALLLGTICMFVFAVNLHEYYKLGKQPYKRASEWISAEIIMPAWNREEWPLPRVLSIGVSSEIYTYYDPTAVEVGWGKRIPAKALKNTVVVCSHSWMVAEENLELVKASCRKMKTFPSAGYKEYEVNVYKCP